MNQFKKGLYAATALGLMASFLPSVRVGAMEEMYRGPVLSGTAQTWLYEGEAFDEMSSRNRVFADDLEDGDLTDQIRETYNNVNTDVPGEYQISYEVEDREGNKAHLDTRVSVLKRSGGDDRLVRRTLYTLGNASHLTDISFNRGYYHDRQSLGIWIPEGASLEVRLANGGEFSQDLQIGFMNQDSGTESTAVIPASGEFVTVKNTFTREGEEESRDSVPFIVTPKGTQVQPVIEFKWNDQLREIPYYRYQDEEQDFFDRWRVSKDPYAVIEGTSATFLVPIKDMDQILNSSYTGNPAYRFQTIDEMLEWYDAFVEQYDAFAGLEFNPVEAYDQNLRSRFFIKANESGVGQAYYSWDHSAYNGDSLNAYLTRGWLSLHEFGHGYEGALAAREHPFVETTNNIMGYYFEPAYRAEDDFGWLLGGFSGTKEQRYAALERRAKQRREETDSFAGIVAGAYHYDVSLYMFTNILDRIGPQEAVSAMHRQYRKNFYQTGKHSSSSDVILESFSRAGEYNVLPYFETYHIRPSARIEEKIYGEDYPILYYLHDLIPDTAAAERIRKELGLNGIYDLVSTDDLADTGCKSQVELHIRIDDLDQIRDRNILVKNGKQIVKVIPVTSEIIQTELPAGAYEIELPVPRSQTYRYGHTYLIASAGKALQELRYDKEAGDPLIDDLQVRLAGLSDAVFAYGTLDTARQKLLWKSEKVVPHSYFSDIYAGIRILDASGRETFSQTFQGNVQAEEVSVELDFPAGSRMEIYHREAGGRLQFVSRYTGEKQQEYGKDGLGETTVYVMTEHGLMKEEWEEGMHRSVYRSCLNAYSECLINRMNRAGLQSPGRFREEKLLIRKAYQKLTTGEQEQYRKQWGILLGIGQNSYVAYEKVPSADLTAFADSESGIGNDGVAADAVDGDENTYWHSNYGDGVRPDIPNNTNNSFTILLKENMDIGKLEYVPRKGGGNGTITAYELYYSTAEEGEDFQKVPLEDHSWSDNGAAKSVEFQAPGARRLRIRALATSGSTPDTFISAAEFYVYALHRYETDESHMYLSNLHRVYEKSEKEVPGQDRNGYGKAISLLVEDSEKKFDKGIGLLAGGSVTYDFSDRPFDLFTAYVGVDASEDVGREAQVRIYGDDVLLYQSGILRSKEAAEFLDLDIRGVSRLQITVSGKEEGTAVSLGDARLYLTEDREEMTLEVGETARMSENSTIFGKWKGTVHWESDNESAAVVDRSGNITAVGAGTAVIKACDSERAVLCTIQVIEAKVEQIRLSQAQLSLLQGESAVLRAVVFPEFATNPAVIWSSGDENVARVDQQGRVTAAGPGSTQIRAVSQDSGQEAFCTVQVASRPAAVEPPSKEPEVKEPGRVTGVSVTKNQEKSLRISWNRVKEADGYEIWRAKKGSSRFVKAADVKAASYQNKKLAPGSSYTYKVRAYVRKGKTVYGAFSDTVWNTTKPKKVKIKKIRQVGKQAAVTWKKDAKAEGFEIWAKGKSGQYKKMAGVSGKKVSVKVKKLKPGQKYLLKVRAYRRNAAKKKVYGSFSKAKPFTLK